MRLLRLLFFRRWRRTDSTPIREQEAYARSYGMRTGEVLSVVRMPEPEPEPAPEPEPEPVAVLDGVLTGELLRRAFEAKLDARGKATT